MFDEKEYECTVSIRNFSDEKTRISGSAAKTESEAGEYVPRSSCVVSVLDAAGNRRFPTSHMFCPERENKVVAADGFPPFIMDHVVKSDTLLEEPDELLPDDCLTLHIHISTRRIVSQDDNAGFEFTSSGSEDARLPLDSALAKRLMGVSSYFRALSEAPMVERQRGYATFSDQEFVLIRRVCDILFRKTSFSVFSVEDLLEIYAAADKYDVPPVLESCRGMLSLVLGAAENHRGMKDEVVEEIPKLLDLAGTLNDVRLKEIGESFLDRNRDEDSGTEESAGDRLEAGWRLLPVDEHYSCFTFVKSGPEREEEFRFYH